MAMAFRGFGRKSPTGFDALPMPGVIGGYGGGTWNADGTQATPVQADYAPAPVEPPVENVASSTGKPNWAGIAADFLAGLAGQQPVFAPMQAHEKARQQAFADAQQQRQQSLADKLWLAQQEAALKAANPTPTELQRNYEWLTAQGRTADANNLIGRSTQNVQWVRADNGDGTFTMVPVSGAGMAQQPSTPTRPVGKLTPIPEGGQTPPASGGF